MVIEGEKTTRHRPEPPLHPPTPPRDPQISPHTPMSPLTYPIHWQRQPQTLSNIPDTQQTSSVTLISPRVFPDFPWQTKCLTNCLMSARKYPRLFLGDLWGCLGCLGVFWSVQGCFGSVGGCIHALRGIWEHFLLNSHQFPRCTNRNTDIFQKTWRSQMSQISKCPKVTVILSYWEASGEVSKLRYKSLLYFSSNGSYCI